MSDILQLPMEFKDPPPPNQIYEVKRYEDDRGRAIVSRDAGDGLQFWGQGLIDIQNVGQIPLNFQIDASDIYDAFDKCDAAGKKAYEKKVKELESEARRQAIISGATGPFKHPRNGKIV